MEIQNSGIGRVRLSKMAAAPTHGEDSPYFVGWKEYNNNRYDPHTNPSGIIQMGLAENQVALDLFQEWMKKHPEAVSWNFKDGKDGFKETALFQDYHGMDAFKKCLASFMEDVRGKKVTFDPQRIVLAAGATSANELVTFCIADPGDVLLVPTPYYPGFDRDLRWRTGVQIVPVPCYSANNFQVTTMALEEAFQDTIAKKLTVRGILVTNPSNPLGTSMSRNTLKDLLKFASAKNIHLICDEIFSGTVFRAPEFISIAEVLKDHGTQRDYERVHIVYSLSKDLGIPGFRVGALYSYNNEVVTAARRMSSFGLVSSQTQHFLACVLSDKVFTNKLMDISRSRLRERHRLLVNGLQRAGIKCLESNAGVFCWVNLSHLLPSNGVEGELELWKIILYQMGLNVSPGSSCHCSEPGWFRVCFANMSERTLLLSLQRIQEFIGRSSATLDSPMHATAENVTIRGPPMSAVTIDKS